MLHKNQFNKKLVGFFLLLSIAAAGCKKDNDPDVIPPPPVAVIDTTTTNITIDRSVKQQTIDGFGFFGAQDVWWGNAANMYSDAWANLAIKDLGITIWRDELHPPATAAVAQDADWNKHKPVVEGLVKIATENRVPLKFIFTVWSPPADLKCAVDAQNEPISGTPHPGGTKNGGTLDPAKYVEFGNWLADGIQLYKNSGADIYAISPQNEPFFKQPFNSCFYKPEKWYGDMLKNSIPVVKARFPNVKVFGSENMLAIEAGGDKQYFYNDNLKKDAAALQNLDVWAVHGYAEGITPTASSELARLWKVTKEEHKDPSGKPYWMTETSGYSESWKGTATQKSGALNLAMDIHAALYFGNVSAWVWWQGSQLDDIKEYNLMKGSTARGKKYYVSKHFYRFIRPGAKMVQLTYDDQANVFASAFEHTAMGAFTIVAINNTDKNVKLNLDGANIPDTFDFYVTTSSQNCEKKDAVNKNQVVLPPSSVVTLVNGNFME